MHMNTTSHYVAYMHVEHVSLVELDVWLPLPAGSPSAAEVVCVSAVAPAILDCSAFHMYLCRLPGAMGLALRDVYVCASPWVCGLWR